jgi:polyisoprenoid-binding protein YceI
MNPFRGLRGTAAMLLLAAASLCAAATLESAGSEIVFTTRQLGVPVEGRFTRFSAQIELDPARPEAVRVVLSIETASARFGAAELDAEVGKPTWLAAARFARAEFRSTSIRAPAPGRFEISGKLALKGKERDLTVPVQLERSGSRGVASGSFVLKRLDFDIGEGEWKDTSLLANDVQVRFKLALTGLP